MKKIFILFLFLFQPTFGADFAPYVIDFERIKTINIIDASADSNMQWISREFLDNSRVTTPEEFWDLISNRYIEVHDKIKKQWKIENEQLLEAVFFMNVTANLWPYGNKIATHETGCACQNEIMGDSFKCDMPFENNVEGYLYSPIACCSDHARVMRFLLTKSGITNRYMLNPGHVFVEAFIGKWYGLDATTNMLWHDSWWNIQNAEFHYHFSVSIFPIYGEVASHPFYRQFIGVFRHYMLLEAVYKMAKDIKHPDVYVSALNQESA